MDLLSSQEAEAVVRAIESASQVKRRFQFFIWTRSHLHAQVPHELAICGSYQRARRDLVMEAFNSVPVPPQIITALTSPASPLVQQLVGAWIECQSGAVRVDLAALGGAAVGPERDELLQLGFRELIVHGVARPQRPTELESLFILAPRSAKITPQQVNRLDMMLPHLHSTYLRMQAAEREVLGSSTPTAARKRPNGSELITRRERQILVWVREGKSNQEIGEQLEISALTVKNHVQKILRKLDASNRAHAVAKAMRLNLLGRTLDEEIGSGHA